MGGRLEIHLSILPGDRDVAARDASRVARRIVAWAGILTRHDPGSALMRLNGDVRAAVSVGPTLGAALGWADEAGRITGGLVDVTRLDERLAAESGDVAAAPPVDRGWHVAAFDRRRSFVTRAPGLRFDLDGTAKGWLADRALRLLDRHPGAIVDADGDVAVRLAPGECREIGVADPRSDGDLIAVIGLEDGPAAPGRGRRSWGVATSGTSVHRFGPNAHHLIDPRTGRPAVTDVIQATVLASSAASAEAFAKSAVILGAASGLDFLDRAGVAGAVLLLADGRVLALPRTTAFLS